MPIRAIFDSNIYDSVAADECLKRLIERCQADDLITIRSTHIVVEELAKIPSHRDIGQATAVSTERIGSGVFVLDYSRLGEDRLGTAETNTAFAELQNNNPKHTEDAMIGATALIDADILVTNDDRFKKKFVTLGSGVMVMSSDEFAAYLAGLSSSAPSGN